MSRRAKIVCTLGPASSSPAQVAALVAAGLDVARLNMSHGDHDAHRAAYEAVRAASDASGRSVGVLISRCCSRRSRRVDRGVTRYLVRLARPARLRCYGPRFRRQV